MFAAPWGSRLAPTAWAAPALVPESEPDGLSGAADCSGLAVGLGLGVGLGVGDGVGLGVGDGVGLGEGCWLGPTSPLGLDADGVQDAEGLAVRLRLPVPGDAYGCPEPLSPVPFCPLTPPPLLLVWLCAVP